MTARAEEGTAAKPVFSPVVALALVAVGVLSLLFYTVFAAYAPDYEGEFDPRPNAVSRSAVGFAGLVSFLRSQGVPVLISRGLDDEEFEKASLIVLTPSLNNTASEFLSITHKEPQLVILPKWLAAPDPLHAGWVRNAGLLPADRIAERLVESESQSSKLSQANGVVPVRLRMAFDGREATPAPIEALQTVSGPGWVGYVTDQQNRSLVARFEGTESYLLADPDLMNTHGLKNLATARVAAAIIQAMRDGDGPVIFDVTLSGYRRSPNILRLAFEPPFLGATLCALFAALLMGVHAAVRFGGAAEATRALALGKQVLADNSAALIAMVRREHRIVPRYAAAIRRRVARIVGAPADARDEELNDMLEKMRPRTDKAQPIAQLVAEAATAEDAADALRIARKLHRWRRGMIHER